MSQPSMRDRLLAVCARGATLAMLASLAALLIGATVVAATGRGGAGRLGAPIMGSVLLGGIGLVVAFPLGAVGAIATRELGHGPWSRRIDLLVSAMASLPSIVYGLGIGYLLLRAGGLGGLMTTGLALGAMAAPFVYVASREALDAVPRDLREAASALGADRWRRFQLVVLPLALPGILTGAILAVARIVGETAVLLVVVALATGRLVPGPQSPEALPLSLFADLTATARPVDAAATALLALMIVVLALNSAAIYLRASRPVDL